MEKIVDLFTALRVLPKAYDDDRTEASLQLMQYLKQTDRQDKYVKYIHGNISNLACARVCGGDETNEPTHVASVQICAGSTRRMGTTLRPA
jgi:hypothetical protein